MSNIENIEALSNQVVDIEHTSETDMTAGSAENVVVGNFNKPADLEQEIIDSVRDMQAQGTDINVIELAVHLDFTPDMVKVRKFLINSQTCTKAEWAAALKVARARRELGTYPRTAVELVAAVIKREKIAVDYQKRMKTERLPVLHGTVVTEEDRKDVHVDTMARIQENIEINTDTLRRDIRLLVSDLDLRFTAQEVEDATSKWFEDAVSERVTEVMRGIIYQGAPNTPSKVSAWDAVCSQFDLDDHDAEYVKAILSKFIWQVKRKMIGLPIYNHLMPVILGGQRVGKSTFVTNFLLKPVAELASNTDFKMIEETRNTEQWRNYVLFLDEMGYAGKADVDNVKNKITATSVTGRPMRSNDNVQYAQRATFIGCSNKELDQLIVDETGNRRFASLRFAKEPDWSRMDGVNQYNIWLSVDERGDDPSIAIMDQLRARQEETRERSAVEQWLDAHETPAVIKGKRQDGAELYKAYKDWADVFTPGRIMDSRTWGKEFNRLIKSGQVSGWDDPKRSNGKTIYVYR